MKPRHRLVLPALLGLVALGLPTAGCGADPVARPGEPSGGGDDGGGDGSGGPPPVKPLDATGRYTVHSTFDLATHVPGTAGAVVNTIIAATDGDADPTQWILEQLIAQVPNDTLRSVLGDLAPFAAPALNHELEDALPDILSSIVLVGSDFGTIAKQFGLTETLELARAGDGYTAVHSVTGVHFTLDNQEIDFALASYHVPNIVVRDIAVAMDPTGQLTIAPHELPFAYGQVLRLGLDAGIIPLIDPSAQNLGQLLNHLIDCRRVGSAVAGAIEGHLPFGLTISAETLASYCTSGLNAAAAYVYTKIAAIDGTALTFGLNGTARGVDRNRDRAIDAIQTGNWSGTLRYGTTPTPLVPAAFFGERQ